MVIFRIKEGGIIHIQRGRKCRRRRKKIFNTFHSAKITIPFSLPLGANHFLAMDLNPPVKLSVINSFIHARLMGDENYLLKGINEIHLVRDGDLTFVDHPKYYDKALKSDATVILINKEVER